MLALRGGLYFLMNRLSFNERCQLFESPPMTVKELSELTDSQNFLWSEMADGRADLEGFSVRAEIPRCSQNLVFWCLLDLPM